MLITFFSIIFAHQYKAKMILHIFNPEHDLALANNTKHFIAPHAARQLKADLGFLPALWAEDGDLILVNNLASATKHLQRFTKFIKRCHLVSEELLAAIKSDITEIRPWGWNESLKQELLNMGLSEKIMPTEQQLFALRQMSNRQFAQPILYELYHGLPYNNIIGRTAYLSDPKEISPIVKIVKKAILKAPWSSSGRGIRYIDERLDSHALNWAHNTMRRQCGVMIEPFYHKIKDFGMEFFSYADKVVYQGLSLFQTTNGAYTGSLLQTETEKLSIISQYIDIQQLTYITLKLEEVLFKHIKGRYVGAFGVDMMIVPNDNKDQPNQPKFFLHPMVEINLRRTMGHAALALSHHKELRGRIMRIEYDGSHYHLHLKKPSKTTE